MVKKFIALLAIMTLTACGTTKEVVRTEYVEVKVPVYTPVEQPPETPLPELLISKIDDKTSDSDVIKYYEATVEQLKGHVRELNKIIDGYRTKK